MERIEAQRKLADILKNNGSSATAARRAVFDALFRHEPQAISEIVDRIGSAADRASVYRTLELFEKLGIVVRIPIGWKYKLELSDLFSEHHHHLTCTQCGRSVTIKENPYIETYISEVSKSAEFHPISHQLEISGLCKNCLKSDK